MNLTKLTIIEQKRIWTKILAILFMITLTSCYSIKSSVINKLDNTFPRSKYTIERIKKIKDSLSKREWQKIEINF